MADRTHSAPWLDLFSYGRLGPSERPALTAAHIEYIRRSVGRSPEVMIKVLPKGAGTTHAVASHFAYVGREGERAIETDDGQSLQDEKAGATLAADWSLDMEAEARSLEPRAQQRSARLIHKLVFSMPPGTAPEKVLRATKAFCREEFALKHRYVLVLHTDEAHPHVHVIVKAMSESGQRLNIRKDTLRAWRESFAKELRNQGVPAHASSRRVRGNSARRMSDGRYRSVQRGASILGARSVARTDRPETVRSLVGGWVAVGEQLRQQGQHALSHEVFRFVRQLPGLRVRRGGSASLPADSALSAPVRKIDELVHVR